MNKITLPNASKLTSPNPVTLVCTQKPNGGTNVATVSWWTYLSYNPAMIAFAMAKTSYSGELIRSGKDVTVTVPGAEIADKVMGCGMSSGRDTDKIAKLGISMQQLPDCSIEIPMHSRVAICCELKEFVEVGDHYLYICNVKQVFGDEQQTAVFAYNGYAEIHPAR